MGLYSLSPSRAKSLHVTGEVIKAEGLEFGSWYHFICCFLKRLQKQSKQSKFMPINGQEKLVGRSRSSN